MKIRMTLGGVRLCAAVSLSALLAAYAAPAAATPGVGVLQTLYTFTAANGCTPLTAMTLGSDGNLYGTTEYGGANSVGAIYKLTPSGTQAALYSFDGSIGEHPVSGLFQDSSGNFYGTVGPTNVSIPGGIYKFSTDGTVSIFAPDISTNSPLIQGRDGNFYVPGFSNGNGAVFKITPGGTAAVVASLSGYSSISTQSLVQDSSGNLYGTTSAGGTSGVGSVFELSLSGTLTTTASFNGANGDNPTGLIVGSDGNFYGTTSNGGSNGYGTAFRVTPGGGTVTTVASFTAATGEPRTALALGGDGNFYGSTTQGLFQLAPGGTLTLLSSQTSTAPMAWDPTATCMVRRAPTASMHQIAVISSS